MGERLWYYLQNNNQMGPVPESELARLLSSSGLNRDALVWSDLLAQWTPADQTESFGPTLRGGHAAAGVQTPAGQQFLAPSELVLLHADRFAAKAGFIGNGNFKLLHSEGEVGLEPTARALFATSVLASEQQGVLRLGLQQKKALLGLRTVTVLVAEPTGKRADWPQGSFEAQIQELLSAGPQEVENLFFTIMAEDSTAPWWDAVHKAIWAMEHRGLILREETKKFLSLNVRLRATPEVLHFAAGQDVTWIQGLLAQTEQTRPDLWKLLTKAINSTISRRRESSSDSDGPDFDSGPND